MVSGRSYRSPPDHTPGSPTGYARAALRVLAVELRARPGEVDVHESGTNRGRLCGLVLPVGVGEAGVPASVVVGEGWGAPFIPDRDPQVELG